MRLSSSFFDWGTPRLVKVPLSKTVLKQKLIPNLIKIVSQGLVFSSFGLLCCLDVRPAWSETADDQEIVTFNEAKIEGVANYKDYEGRFNLTTPNVATIREIVKKVIWHSGSEFDQNWTEVDNEQKLVPPQWLATGINAAANYIFQLAWFEAREFIYRQEANTYAQFAPNSENSEQICGFKIQHGKALYAKGDIPPGCPQTLRGGNTTVVPPSPPSVAIFLSNKDVDTTQEDDSAIALFVFRNQDAQETIVGVLASPLGPVTITNTNREDPNCSPTNLEDAGCLNAGEYAFVSDDGTLIKGTFSLRHFYENNPLGFGLGPDPEYVEGLSGGKKRLFEKIRKATLEALENQPEAGPFELKTTNAPSIPGFRTVIDIETSPNVEEGGDPPVDIPQTPVESPNTPTTPGTFDPTSG